MAVTPPSSCASSAVCPLGPYLVMTPWPLGLVVYVLATLVDSWCQKIPKKGRWHDKNQGHLGSEFSPNAILPVVFANL